ncbi:hypothetical protein KV205_10575 [Streptomyces sp. SKN60]|uniref:hypothetical protein n=1 Tax=Streptomyces sp. SKN60 TaxID=2855506 RepID=UPI002246CBAC|nr:hypothetical protein [Streptomyces sp. SKN60]MCX2180973.1 hypothetical protein [Streptomyces sp. SKN60]
MNLTTTSRGLVAALALTAGLLAFGGTATAYAATTATAVVLEDGPEPVELNELGLPDLLDD